MDTKLTKTKNNESGVLSQQLSIAEVSVAYVTPVPANAPGRITLELGTANEEEIYFQTRDAGAGTISGLTRDVSNLNGGVGRLHQAQTSWESVQSATYVNSLADILTDGFQEELAATVRTSGTTFTVAGDKTSTYYAGRYIRINETTVLIVESSSYNGGTLLTTVTVTGGTITSPMTKLEKDLQAKGRPAGSSFISINDTNGNEVIRTPATSSAVNDITVTNATAGNAPEISATGDDTNIDLKLKGKGSGRVKVWDGTTYIEVGSALADAWIPFAPACTFLTANTFKMTGDYTAVFKRGALLKLTNSTVKFFVVNGTPSFSGGETTVTVTGGSDYSLATGAISDVYYSYQVDPQGFPAKFNFNASPTGFSGSPTSSTYFSTKGRTVTIWFDIEGTSNATTFTLTHPFDRTGLMVLYLPGGYSRDNGIALTTPPSLNVLASTTINVYKDPSTAAWTASGSKRIIGSITFDF